MMEFTDANHAKHRVLPMTHTVSFHRVPMPRGLAFVNWHIEHHGGLMFVWSVDRRDRIIAEHNRQFGTNLHGQQWLIDAHARDPKRYAAANRVDRTSHCLYADGNAAYRDSRGRIRKAGARLAPLQIGGD